MLHPSLAAIMAHLDDGGGDAAVGAHLEACALCRQVAGLGNLVARRALVEPITVDRELYEGREPLRADHAGMGRAYRSWDRRLGRAVVIKQIAGDPRTRNALRARFEREARITARLQHPGIVGVLELGQWDDGEPFYTMPLVDGEPLDEAIGRATDLSGRLELLPRLAAAADAIAYAHDRGVVHRDVKPANIILGRFGETVVIDWGLAAEVGAHDADADGDEACPAPRDGLTVLGVGTVQYMPPEQARGEAADPRTDVHALGATLYHLLAGAPPYGRGPSDEVRRRLIAGAPAPLAELAPAAPAELLAIVARAMAREPEARFASALELADELRRFLTGQLTRSYRYGPTELLRHWLRRHRAAVRVAVLAVAVGAVLAALAVTRIVRERDRAQAARRAAERGRSDAEASLADARAAEASLLAATPATRLVAVERAALAAAPSWRRGAAVPPAVARGLLDALTAGPVPLPLADQAMQRLVWFLPDGARFVTTDGRGRAVTWNARTGAREAELSPSFGEGTWLDVAPDGARVAIIGLAADVDVWTPATGARWTATTGPSGAGHARFRADGALVTAGADGTLRLWDRDGAPRAVAQTSCVAAHVTTLGELAIVACRSHGLLVWSPARGRMIAIATAGEAALAATPDGSLVYAATGGGEVRAWSAAELGVALDGGAAPPGRMVSRDPSTAVFGVRATPDASLVVITRGHAQIVGNGVERIDPDFTPQLQPLGPDARLLLGARETALIGLELRRGEPVLRLPGHGALRGEPQVAASPDGQRVVSITAAGEAWLWDARLALTAGQLAQHDAEVVSIAIDPAAGRALSVGLDGSVRAGGLAGGPIDARAGVTIAASAVAAGGLALAGGDDGVARLWSASGGEPRSTAIGDASVSAVALAADGASAAAGDVSGRARWWSLADGAAIAAVAVPGDPVGAIAIAPDGTWCATGHHSGAVRIWDRAGRPRGELRGDGAVLVLAVASDGALAAGRAGDRTQLARGEDGWRPVDLVGRPVGPGAWSGDALLLVDGAGRVTVRGQQRSIVLADDGAPVVVGAWSADGARAFTADSAGRVTAWDVAAGRALATVGASDPVGALAPTPDGRWLLVGTTSGAVRVVPLVDDAARETACAVLHGFGRAPRECPPTGH